MSLKGQGMLGIEHPRVSGGEVEHGGDRGFVEDSERLQFESRPQVTGSQFW
jgi:hypothetical protein